LEEVFCKIVFCPTPGKARLSFSGRNREENAFQMRYTLKAVGRIADNGKDRFTSWNGLKD